MPFVVSIEDVGGLRALLILLLPMFHVIMAIGRIVLQMLVTTRQNPGFNQIVWAASTLLISGSILYWLVLAQWSQAIVTWILGAQYTTYASLYWLLGLVPVPWALTLILGVAFQAMEQPKQQFLGNLRACKLALPVSLILTVWGGITGVISAMLFWCILVTVHMGILYRHTVRVSVSGERGKYVIQPVSESPSA